LEGYIYKNRVSFIPSWKEIKNIDPTNGIGIFKAGDLNLSVRRSTFNPKNHKLSFILGKELVKIDAEPFWGTDGERPQKVTSSVTITQKGNEINIPSIAFSDLYEPNLRSISLSFSSENTTYIKMDNSDGAGGYSVIWIIKGTDYVGRYIDNSED
jgi:hypothetical protein